MKHARYVDTVKQIAASNWGKQFETDEQAQQELLKSIDLSGACLLGIVRRIDRFLSLLARETVQDSILMLSQDIDKKIDEFVAPRVAKHGPCPPKVMVYLHSEMLEHVGASVLYGEKIPTHVYEPVLPRKGTVARKEYDKWIRRKVAS